MTERRKDDRFYVRIDIGFWDHPKALAAGPDGRNLYLVTLAWSRGQLTDGAVPAAVLPLLAFKAGLTIDSAQAAADRLLEVRLWERTPDGWEIHDYAEHQLTRQDIDDQREQWRQRQAASRARRKAVDGEQTLPGVVDVTGDSRVSHSGITRPETETETETEISLSLAEAPTPPPRAGARERDALAHLANRLAAGATNPDAYAVRVIREAVQLPALSALAAEHPTATGPELAVLYLGQQPDTTTAGPARTPRCGICRGDAHPNGPADCPELELGPGLLEVTP